MIQELRRLHKIQNLPPSRHEQNRRAESIIALENIHYSKVLLLLLAHHPANIFASDEWMEHNEVLTA